MMLRLFIRVQVRMLGRRLLGIRRLGGCTIRLCRLRGSPNGNIPQNKPTTPTPTPTQTITPAQFSPNPPPSATPPKSTQPKQSAKSSPSKCTPFQPATTDLTMRSGVLGVVAGGLLAGIRMAMIILCIRSKGIVRLMCIMAVRIGSGTGLSLLRGRGINQLVILGLLLLCIRLIHRNITALPTTSNAPAVTPTPTATPKSIPAVPINLAPTPTPAPTHAPIPAPAHFNARINRSNAAPSPLVTAKSLASRPPNPILSRTGSNI